MPGLLTRILVHDLVQLAMGLTFLYGFYLFLTTGELSFWAVGFLILAVASYSVEARLSRATTPPGWKRRILGHPLIAWPMIALLGLLWALIVCYAFLVKGLPSPEISLVLVALSWPIAYFVQLVQERKTWRNPSDAPVADDVPRVPLALSLPPAAQPHAASIPEAMQRLPEPLLQLVRSGMAEHQASATP